MNSRRAFGEVSSPIAIPSLRFSSVILRPFSSPMDVLSRLEAAAATLEAGALPTYRFYV